MVPEPTPADRLAARRDEIHAVIASWHLEGLRSYAVGVDPRNDRIHVILIGAPTMLAAGRSFDFGADVTVE
jgi:hypothetical protein